MSALPYHKRYHGDALTGFMALTLEERGAYQTILDLIYDHGGPVIDNERLLAGYMNCSLRKWRTLRDELIAKRKIKITRDGLITNERAEKEIENTAKTSRKLAESGAKGGRVRAENEKKANENNEGEQASLDEGLSDPQAISEARSQSSVDESTGGEPPDLLKAMFDDGLALLTSTGTPEKQARSLLGKWKKAKGEAEVLVGLADCRAKRIEQPVEWLEKRFKAARYISPSGYEYRGDDQAVMKEAEKRSDWGTYWSAKSQVEARATA